MSEGRRVQISELNAWAVWALCVSWALCVCLGLFGARRLTQLCVRQSVLGMHFDEAFSFMEDAVNSSGGVLVFCGTGRSFSPTLICQYLMRSELLTAEVTELSALLHALSATHCVCLYPCRCVSCYLFRRPTSKRIFVCHLKPL